MSYLTLPPEVIPEITKAVNLFMSFAPLLSYGTTVLSIRRNKSSNGFSMDICATMIISSTLRIFYYFNDPFELSLLRQCIVMIFIQIILLRVALNYRPSDYSLDNLDTYESNLWALKDDFVYINKTQLLDEINTLVDEKDEQIFSGFLRIVINIIRRNIIFLGVLLISIFKDFLRLFDAHYIRPFKFWQWRSEITYWKFLAFFVFIATMIQLIFKGNEYLGITFGSVSFLVESSLPLPQILMFNRVKTVENFKTILLLSWLGGDLTKISYLFYGTDNVTTIFIIAAFFQMSLNLIITYQFFHYKKLDKMKTMEEYSIPLSTIRTETRITSNPALSRANTVSHVSNINLVSPLGTQSTSSIPKPSSVPGSSASITTINTPAIPNNRSRSSTLNEHYAINGNASQKRNSINSVQEVDLGVILGEVD